MEPALITATQPAFIDAREEQAAYTDPHTAQIRRRLANGWSARVALLQSVVPAGARAIDVGCAYGEYTLPLATVAGHVDALDIDQKALEAVAAFASEFEISNITTVNEGLVSWSQSRAGQYNFCVCTNTLMLLDPETRRGFLDGFHRLLAVDGLLFVDFYLPRYHLYRFMVQNLPLSLKLRSLGAFASRAVRRAFLTEKVFEQESAQSGFTIVKRPADLCYPGSSYHACRSVEGHNMDTIFGPYFVPYLLKRAGG